VSDLPTLDEVHDDDALDLRNKLNGNGRRTKYSYHLQIKTNCIVVQFTCKRVEKVGVKRLISTEDGGSVTLAIRVHPCFHPA
jgi:hypothetical protein